MAGAREVYLVEYQNLKKRLKRLQLLILAVSVVIIILLLSLGITLPLRFSGGKEPKFCASGQFVTLKDGKLVCQEVTFNTECGDNQYVVIKDGNITCVDGYTADEILLTLHNKTFKFKAGQLIEGRLCRYAEGQIRCDIDLEYQTLYFNPRSFILSIYGGNSVNLSGLLQDAYREGDTLRLTHSESVVDLSDLKQALALDGTMLSISNGNTVDLSLFLDNTDAQLLSLNNNELSISGGNTVTFVNWDTDVTDDVILFTELLDTPADYGTNGYLLQTDGVGGLQYVDPLTLDVGYWQRSGTTLSPRSLGDNVVLRTGEDLILQSLNPGSVVYMDGAHALDTSTSLVWDFTNSRLGVGTSAPQYTFHVDGQAYFGDITYFNSSLLPIVDNTVTLGSPSLRFKDLYLGPGTLYIGQGTQQGSLSYNLSQNTLEVQAENVRLNTSSGALIRLGNNALELSVQSGGSIFLKTDQVINSTAANDYVLSVKDVTTGEVEFRRVIEPPAGVVDGQMIYWNTATGTYQLTDYNDYSRNVPFMQYRNGKLFIGEEATLAAPSEVLTVVGNIKFERRFNHIPGRIYGVNSNSYIELSSRYSSQNVIASASSSGTLFTAAGSNVQFRIGGAAITYNAVNASSYPLLTVVGPTLFKIGGGTTTNNHLPGASIEILAMQPHAGSAETKGGSIFIDGGLGRDGLEFESGGVYIGAKNKDTKVGVGTVSPIGKLDVVEQIRQRADITENTVTATATSELPTNPAAFVYDNDITTPWVTDGSPLPQSITFEFNTAVQVEKLRIYFDTTDPVLNTLQYAPTVIVVYGSTDGTTWVTAATLSGIIWSAPGWKEFNVASKTAYQFYRVEIRNTPLAGTDDTTGIYELELLYTQSTVDVRALLVRDAKVGILTDSPQEALQVGNPGDGTVAIANSWLTFSDKRLKTEVVDITDALDTVNQLRPVFYKWKGDNSTHLGFIAQEVYQVLPEVVNIPNSDAGYWSLDYTGLVPLLVKAVQELGDKLESMGSGLGWEVSNNGILVGTYPVKVSGLESGRVVATAIEATTVTVGDVSISADGTLIAGTGIIGDVKAQTIETNTLKLQKSGRVVIPAGMNKIQLAVDGVAESDLVIATVVGEEPLAVSAIAERGVITIFIQPQDRDIQVNWMVVSSL